MSSTKITERDCCASCSKWLLIIFNVLFLLIGVALVALGIYVYVAMKNTFVFFSPYVNIPAIVIIVLGVITVVITSLGCCGAIKESRGALIAFGVIVMLLLIAEIVVGALAVVYHNKTEELVRKALTESMPRYLAGDSTVREAWDSMQRDLECCGVTDRSDWTTSTPPSCNNYSEGCLMKINDEVQRNALIIGAAAIAFALAQFIGVVLAFCLTCRIGKGFLV